MQCIENPTFWVINTLNPLPISTYGRVALLGDAVCCTLHRLLSRSGNLTVICCKCHAMSPYQGAGAGQAIEDAFILSTLLASPLVTRAMLPTALKVYEEVRLPLANEVLRRSKLSAEIGTFNDSRFASLLGRPSHDVDAGALWDMGHALIDNWKWAWTTNIDGDEEKAVKLLQERIIRQHSA